MDVTTGPGTDNCSGVGAPILSQTTFVTADTGLNVVTVTVTDTAGNAGNCTANVTVIDTFFVGIEEELLTFGFSFTASPNPTNGLVRVDIQCTDCSPLEETELQLTSLDGKVLLRESVIMDGGELSKLIDMSQYSQGNYLLSVRQQGVTLIRRIVRY